MLEAQPAWLALDRAARGAWAKIVHDACARHPEVAVSWFDADGLSGRYSDFVTCHFSDLEAYQFLWDTLRDLELFSRPYFRIVDVVLGRENAYQAYEAAYG